MPKLKGKRLWLEDEIVVLCAMFSILDFSAGDDEKIECKILANAFGRSPGTVDRQWRNVKDYLAGKDSKKIAKDVKRWSDITRENPTLVRNYAKLICERNDWNIEDLINFTL